jgi:hypothetical protein
MRIKAIEERHAELVDSDWRTMAREYVADHFENGTVGPPIHSQMPLADGVKFPFTLWCGNAAAWLII